MLFAGRQAEAMYVLRKPRTCLCDSYISEGSHAKKSYREISTRRSLTGRSAHVRDCPHIDIKTSYPPNMNIPLAVYYNVFGTLTTG